MADEIQWKSLEPLNPADRVQVKDFFKGKSVFITGATGFMGKALVEKLLWSCEDIGNLYLLVRPKKGETGQQRVDEMKKSPVFDRIRQRGEHILSKLVPVNGDIAEIHMGISTEDKKILEDTVTVVFHAASSVRFDDPINKAVLINVRGTREVVDLAKGMKNLKVFIYVSTVYSNCDKPVIEEKFYKPTEVDWRAMIQTVETLDENILNTITPKFLRSFPNTYVFTKNLAESVVHDARCDIPMLIFRPSIILNSLKEPLPGWVDNLNGPIGISTGFLTGVVHCMLVDGDKVTDYIPCDYATNALIVSAWYRGLINTSDCVVIHSAAGDICRITTNSLKKLRDHALDKMPFQRVLWYPSTILTSNLLVYTILFYLTHMLPAVLIDLLLRMRGEKFRMMRLYQKIFLGNKALAYFTTHEWKIETENSDTLRTLLHPKDKDIFPFDMREFDLSECVILGVTGIKKYIMKEDISEEALAKNRKRMKMFKILHYILKGGFSLSISWILLKCFIVPTLTRTCNYFIK